MHIHVIPCGFLKVRAVEMIKPWSLAQIREKYPVDDEGFMRLSMNALLLSKAKQVVLIDPGVAEFLPSGLRQEYGFEMPLALEDALTKEGYSVDDVTDVIFTHLHFDHGSGAFKRVPGKIEKRFPNARYHLLKEHYDYALNPDRVEANSFSTFLFKRLEEIHWIDNWEHDWMRFRVFQGHTRSMVVPEIATQEGKVFFASDLIPMEVFLEPEVYCGYDLDGEVAIREKLEFLSSLEAGSRLHLFHDPLKESIFYS